MMYPLLGEKKLNKNYKEMLVIIYKLKFSFEFLSVLPSMYFVWQNHFQVF